MNKEKQKVMQLKEIEERDDCFYLTLSYRFSNVSDCLEMIKQRKFILTTPTRSVFDSKSFTLSLSSEVKIVILKSNIFSYKDRTIKNAILEGKKRGFKVPSADVAVMLRAMLTNKDLTALDLRWGLVVMHKRIKDSWGRMTFLHVTTYEHGQYISTLPDIPNKSWSSDGFVFCV